MKHLATSDLEFTALMEKWENHGIQIIKRWLKTIVHSDFRYLIRCKSMNEYQTELNSMMIRSPQPYMTYFIQHIHPEIEKFAIRTMKDKAFIIGRDLQKANVTEMARGKMNTGNYELLLEFRMKCSSKVGEDLVRRMSSTPSMDMRVSRQKETRGVIRHAGRGTKNDVVEEIEFH